MSNGSVQVYSICFLIYLFDTTTWKTIFLNCCFSRLDFDECSFIQEINLEFEIRGLQTYQQSSNNVLCAKIDLNTMVLQNISNQFSQGFSIVPRNLANTSSSGDNASSSADNATSNQNVSIDTSATYTRQLSRDLKSVQGVWNEWTGYDGITPSVRDLESRDKSWRTRNPTESRFFIRRFVIIQAIQKCISEGVSEADAVAAVAAKLPPGKSLNWLSEQLRAES